jgi:hypothetical protein
MSAEGRSPEPSGAAPTPPTPVGWQPPDAGDPASTAAPPSTARLLVAWIVGGILLGIAAWLTYRVASGGDAYRAGVFVGAVLGPLIVIAILRFILVKTGAAKGGILRSPWLPLGAGLIAILLAVSRVLAAAPLPPVDPATGLHVAAPFQIVETDPEIVANMQAALGNNEAIRSSVIRSVTGQDGSTSILFVADGEFRDGDIGDVARGMDANADADPTTETIAGHPVVVATLPNGVLATWIAEPLVFTVVAADRATLDQVVAAIIAAQ